MDDPVLLDVKNLKTYFYTDTALIKAVDDVSFSVKSGETIGIVGESGSGKSVTSLSIMRLIQSPPGKIEDGAVFFAKNGEAPVDFLKLDEKEMRKYRGNDLAMIFQEPMTSLNPVFSCGDQVMEAILLHRDVDKKKARSIALELFEKVRLPDPLRIFKSYPHQLSGGQKQRVMIAMALSCNPSILIADEPTTALDVTVQKAILDLIVELKKEIKAAVIFITHDLGVIADIADRVLVMYQGKIVEQGPVGHIFNHPQHPYTKGLLACRPPLDYRLRRLPVIGDFLGEATDKDADRKYTATGIEEVVRKNKMTASMVQQRLSALQEQEPLLQVENLQVWFPGLKNFFGKPKSFIKAVDDVSFEVFPGETMGLVGESGCGKTTLGRAILNLVGIKGGKVVFDGKNILELGAGALKILRKDMQIIFQDPYSSLNPRMPVGSAILEPMKVHKILENDKIRKERAIELLETVNMNADHYNRYPHEFSGGQRQRVCIARALALNPRFIVCDESVSALDVSVQAQVLNLLVELREQYQFTYIFISHDLSVVKFMSDRMIVMNRGKIEEMGPADEIYNDPKKAYTRKLIEAIPKGIVKN